MGQAITAGTGLPASPAARPAVPLAEVEASIEKAREPFAGRGGVLRLLVDSLEIERPMKVEVAEGEADVSDPHPGPGEAERHDEQHRVDEPQAEHGATGHARAEPSGAEGGVAPEEPPLVRGEPEPAEAERGHREEHRQHVRPEEIPASAREVESLVAEVGVRDQEGLAPRDEERVVEAEREAHQERALDEDLDELDGRSAEGKANTTPGGAAQSVPAGTDHRHGDEHEKQQRK